MRNPRSDLNGKKFGLLTIRQILPGCKCICDCDCGTAGKVINYYPNVTSGKTVSCGCVTGGRKIHGEGEASKRTPEFRAWVKLRSRCLSQKDPDYKDYGARGITVCLEWVDSYPNFLRDMGRRPSPQHTIERNDNNLGYSASNCRWATRLEQGRNKRNSRRISAFGRTLALAAWSEATGINRKTISDRLDRGWDTERALCSK